VRRISRYAVIVVVRRGVEDEPRIRDDFEVALVTISRLRSRWAAFIRSIARVSATSVVEAIGSTSNQRGSRDEHRFLVDGQATGIRHSVYPLHKPAPRVSPAVASA
jgi:hypothetical protein